MFHRCHSIRPSGPMEIMFGAKRFNRISIALSIETNSGMGRGDLANLTAFATADDQRSSRGAAARPVPCPRRSPLDAAAGGATRGALAAPCDAQRISDRRRLAHARAAATAIDQSAGAIEGSAKVRPTQSQNSGQPCNWRAADFGIGEPLDDRSRRQLVIISGRIAPFSGSFFSRGLSRADRLPIGLRIRQASSRLLAPADWTVVRYRRRAGHRG
jgi:hypothetical protein